MKKNLTILLLLLSAICNGQIITTIAGGGSSSIEDVPATSSVINNPGQPAFDIDGNFYFPQLLSNKVSKLKNDGRLITIAGSGIAGDSGDGGNAVSALLHIPNTVVIDSIGNIYICDNNNSRIRKIDKISGNISTIAGTGTPGYSGDTGPATNAMLFYPAGICFDRKGNLLISDGNKRIRKVNNLGIISTIAGTGIAGIAGDGGPATAAKCGSGVICVDKIGNLYIADCATGESRIAKIDTFGIITTFAGTGTGYVFNGDNISATAANINPVGIAVDRSGNIIFADRYNNRVRIVNNAGIITTIAGTGVSGFSGDGGPAKDAKLSWPQGIAIDTCGNVFVADNNNARIRKIALNPDCLPMAVPEVTGNTGTTQTIYPNPATATVTINAGEAIAHISINNAVGQQVLELHPSGSKKSVETNVQHLPAGIYVVMVNGLYAGKMVKGE